MKVGVYIVENLTPSHGGTFSYSNKLIASIDNYAFKSPIEICFVGRERLPEIALKRKYVAISSLRKYNFFQTLRRFRILKALSVFFGQGVDLCNKNDHKILIANNVDLILYPKQFSPLIESFPFLTMNWDIGHKTTYIFPEFSRSIDYRDQWYRSEIQKALGVIVESQSGKREFVDHLQFHESKVDVVPLFAGRVIDLNVNQSMQEKDLADHKLEPLGYYLYPAQFWAHKNHYNLLKGFKLLHEKRIKKNLKLVFTGYDSGNKRYISQVINELGLNEVVVDLDFVQDELLFSLYKNCIALVMPSFLGPTNMPLLEALALKTAIICSDLKGHREMCSDAAIYVDPAEPLQWAKAMQTLLDENVRQQYIKNGINVYATSIFKIGHAMINLEIILLKYANIRGTFK
ncbi:MAG: glycosyltransferase family 1 protein [Chryseolinea sp.]